MTVCAYFNRPEGCRDGNQCRYEHLAPSKPTTALPNLRPRYIPTRPQDSASASDLQRDTSRTSKQPKKPKPCPFFALGKCENGFTCRFQHPQPDQVEGKSDKRRLANTDYRNLGGAVVKFGPGAKVLNVKLSANPNERLQLYTVSCSWYPPSKTATLHFQTTQKMSEAAKSLSESQILNRKTTCRVSVDKSTKPFRCLVHVERLDVRTTIKMLKIVCGVKGNYSVTFSPPTYEANAPTVRDRICDRIKTLLPLNGSFQCSSVNEVSNSQCTISVKLGSIENVKAIVNDLNAYLLPELKGSRITACHMMKVTFTILTPIYNAMQESIDEVRSITKGKGSIPPNIVEINLLHRPDKFTSLRVACTCLQDLIAIKQCVHGLLKGQVVTSSKGVLWHKRFMEDSGITYLTNLSHKHKMYIHRDPVRCKLVLYGPKENRATVESLLAEEVDRLHRENKVIAIDRNINRVDLQNAYRQMVAEFGRKAVYPNFFSDFRYIRIDGSTGDVKRARKILREAANSFKSADSPPVEGKNTCSVCWCDALEESFATPCGHFYHQECFIAQCANIQDFPLRCLGANGSCQLAIPYSELDMNLTQQELDDLLTTSFTTYIRTNPTKYQYCPTPSCDQIYAVSTTSTTATPPHLFTCPNCLSNICTFCSSTEHEGLTCVQNKQALKLNGEFKVWKDEHGAKDCSKCGSTIEKDGGCRHVICLACKAHLCWICLLKFETETEAYDHLAKEHGGIFDREEVERIREVERGGRA